MRARPAGQSRHTSSALSTSLRPLPRFWSAQLVTIHSCVVGEGRKAEREGTHPTRSHTAGSRENQGLGLSPAPGSLRCGPCLWVLRDHPSCGSHGRVSSFAPGGAESGLEPGPQPEAQGTERDPVFLPLLPALPAFPGAGAVPSPLR